MNSAKESKCTCAVYRGSYFREKDRRGIKDKQKKKKRKKKMHGGNAGRETKQERRKKSPSKTSDRISHSPTTIETETDKPLIRYRISS